MANDCKTTTIVWFRRDLRIEDNPALSAAAKDGSVLPIFIWCPNEEGQYHPGRVSRWWLKQSLVHLQHSLKSLGADLILIKAQSTLTALLDCIAAVKATKVVFNHLYDPISLVRDHTIKQKLVELGIAVRSYNGDLLYEPWEVYDEKERALTSFEAYWDKCLNMPNEPVSHLPPRCLVQAQGKIENSSIEALALENEFEKPSNALLGRGWSPGWSNADKVFAEFVERHLANYSKDRLRVAGNSTSLLSPYLHFGEISVRTIYKTICMKQIVYKNEENSSADDSATHFLKAIGLREYSRYICFNFPQSHERSLLGNFRYFPWDANEANFKTWRQGRTGYPLVDAGMRELWATGWIHNRIRVIVSSFFVKFLLLPWQWGVKYFWDTLLDADLESDILGWQYISGSLPDGHELERMDAPQIQGFWYDPEGEYVRQWLPELARMPNQWIHHPYDAPPTVLRSAGVDLGTNYPKPVVDPDAARDRLTRAIAAMSGREASGYGTHEVVSVNAFVSPRPILEATDVREETVASSYDQRVPSMGISRGNESLPPDKDRKRTSMAEEDDFDERRMRRFDDGDGERSCNKGITEEASRGDEEDLCSTADSSKKKKKKMRTTSGISMPENCVSSSIDEPFRAHDCSTSSKIG